MRNEKGLRKLKMRLTPPSSLGFHERADAIQLQNDKNTDQLIHELILLNERQSRRFDEVNQKLDRLEHKIAVQNKQLQLYSEGILKNENETIKEAKCRFFKNIPPTTGNMRIFQLANAKVVHALHSICKKNNLNYWFGFGALIAAYVRNGSIPWDDDVDICMMREDLERLIEILNSNDEYEITIVYDWYVSVVQYRFCSKNKKIPCFVDIAVFDWATDNSKAHDKQLTLLRNQLMSEVQNDEQLFDYWKEQKYLFAKNSGYCIQYDAIELETQNKELSEREEEKIQNLFLKYQNKAIEQGIICEKENATAIAYGLSNISDAPWRIMLWPKEMVFPTREVLYEGSSVCVPNDSDAFLDECYPGWPYLPQDIIGGHEHFDKTVLKDSTIVESMKEFVNR